MVGHRNTGAPLPWNCKLWTDFFGTLPLLPDPNGASRVFVQMPQDRPVPTMQAIEVTDGQRTAPMAGIQIVESSYQSHRIAENLKL